MHSGLNLNDGDNNNDNDGGDDDDVSDDIDDDHDVKDIHSPRPFLLKTDAPFKAQMHGMSQTHMPPDSKYMILHENGCMIA